MKIIFLFSISVFLLLSCERKTIKSEKGGVDVITNIYFNASKGLDSIKSVFVSKINYKGDTLIEIVPDVDFPELTNHVFVIKDSLAFNISNENLQQFVFSSLDKEVTSFPVSKKIGGAVFSNEHLSNFYHRKNIKDTFLFKKKYKRFFIHGPESFSTFYVFETDTLLPYSFYKKEGLKYGGRIERIESYNKTKNMYITLQLFPRKKWDEEAKNIFEYNDFIQKRNIMNNKK